MKLLDKIKLVSNASLWYKFRSIQLTAIGSTILTLWFAYNQEIVVWWNLNATDYFTFLEPELIRWIGLLLVISSAFARVHKQKNIPPDVTVHETLSENVVTAYSKHELTDEFNNE